MDSDDDNVEEVVEGNVSILIHEMIRVRKFAQFVLAMFTLRASDFPCLLFPVYYYISLYIHHFAVVRGSAERLKLPFARKN